VPGNECRGCPGGANARRIDCVGPTRNGSQRTHSGSSEDLADYQRLTAEGKLGEAGQKLEELKRASTSCTRAKR